MAARINWRQYNGSDGSGQRDCNCNCTFKGRLRFNFTVSLHRRLMFTRFDKIRTSIYTSFISIPWRKTFSHGQRTFINTYTSCTNQKTNVLFSTLHLVLLSVIKISQSHYDSTHPSTSPPPPHIHSLPPPPGGALLDNFRVLSGQAAMLKAPKTCAAWACPILILALISD